MIIPSFHFARLSVVLLAVLFASAASGWALFYSMDTVGSLYEIESNLWSATNLGTVQYNSSTGLAPLIRPMDLDYDSQGNLYALRTRSVKGQFGRTYYYGEVYGIDPLTVGNDLVADATLAHSMAGMGQMNSSDGGLAFRGDDRFFVTGYYNDGKLVLGSLADTTLQSFTRTDYWPYAGLEWYDDGTANGSVYALSKGSSGLFNLLKLNVNYATSGFYASMFALGPAGAATQYGDLAIDGDMLYFLTGGSTGSMLYSYDLTQGANGSYTFLADLPPNLTSFAGRSEPIPEPGTLLLTATGLAGLGGRFLRRKKTS